MAIRKFATVLGIAVLSLGVGCSDTRRADRQAENAPAETPATSADRADRDWTVERDEYVTRRERELDDLDRRWDSFKSAASAKSRAAWNEVKQESAEWRAELRDLRGASREKWEESKRRIDAGWDRFQAKVRDAFGEK